MTDVFLDWWLFQLIEICIEEKMLPSYFQTVWINLIIKRRVVALWSLCVSLNIFLTACRWFLFLDKHLVKIKSHSCEGDRSWSVEGHVGKRRHLPWALSPNIWAADSRQAVMIVWWLKPGCRCCSSLAWAAEESKIKKKERKANRIPGECCLYRDALGPRRANRKCSTMMTIHELRVKLLPFARSLLRFPYRQS